MARGNTFCPETRKKASKVTLKSYLNGLGCHPKFAKVRGVDGFGASSIYADIPYKIRCTVPNAPDSKISKSGQNNRRTKLASQALKHAQREPLRNGRAQFARFR
jgi:hypothetical protein